MSPRLIRSELQFVTSLWVPVEESLPDGPGPVLLTIEGNDEVQSSIYASLPSGPHWWSYDYDGWYTTEEMGVVAWADMPETYKVKK